MEDLGKDVAYFIDILNSLSIEEQKAEELYQDIRTRLKRSVVRVEVQRDEGQKEGELSESLIQEIEAALLKARLALEKSELMAGKSNKISRQPTSDSCIDKNAKKMPTKASLNKSKSQRQSAGFGITSGTNKCNSTTSTHRPRVERAPSAADLLRKRAKSWLSSSSYHNSQTAVEKSGNTAKKSIETSKVIAPSASFSRAQEQNASSLKSRDYWELNPIIVERINDVIALSKSVERFSKEAHLSNKDTSARDDFLARCDSLSSNASDSIDISVSRQYFAENMPKLVELLEQFFQVLDVIDWNVATPGQHQWRDQMLENFVALFNIAEHFKPLLLGDEITKVKIADSPRKKDSVPSIETIWRAYVCSGQQLPASYTDPPVEIPSRGFRLTLGPAVFSNHPEVHHDLQQMVELWSDVFRLQRRLQILDYIETRLPHWLRLITEQPTEKASTLRLLCRIACDCYPITIEKE